MIFHVQHAWDRQGFVHLVLMAHFYTAVTATTTVQNMTQMVNVLLRVHQDFTSRQTQAAVNADQIVKNAAVQHSVPNARQTCSLIWVIVWFHALQILWYQQTTHV